MPKKEKVDEFFGYKFFDLDREAEIVLNDILSTEKQINNKNKALNSSKTQYKNLEIKTIRDQTQRMHELIQSHKRLTAELEIKHGKRRPPIYRDNALSRSPVWKDGILYR